MHPQLDDAIIRMQTASKTTQCGVLVATRTTPLERVELYQSPSHYTELFWHRHFNTILYTQTFTDLSGLDPYLHHIALPSGAD